MKSETKGFQVVLASWLAVFCLFGYRATFAILKDPMSIELGWSQTQVTLGYSLMMVIYAITAYFSGMILDKWGTKPVYAIAAFFGGLGFFATSQVQYHFVYLITFGLFAGIATGMLWVTSTVSVRKWYIGKSYATMWGIAFAGAPMAQFLLAFLTRAILASGEIDAWRQAMRTLSGVITFALILAVILAKRNPENYGLEPIGSLHNQLDKTEKEWSVKEAFSSYPIWGVVLMFLTSMMAEFLIWTQVVSFWTTDLGWDPGRAISVYAIIGLAGLFTMPLMGFAADKVVKKFDNEIKGRKTMLIIGPLVGLFACVFLLISGSIVLFGYIAAVIFGVYWAIVPGGVVGYTGAVYGRKTLGRIWGLATLIVMGIGPFLGTYIGSWIKDTYGRYNYAIVFAAITFLISIILAMSLPLKIKKSPIK